MSKPLNNETLKETKILIDHTIHDTNRSYAQLLNGKTFGDINTSDIKFIVNKEEIVSHSQVLDIFAKQRKHVQNVIESDKRSSRELNGYETNVFEISGSTPQAFKLILQYIYTGKVEFDIENGVDLAVTAGKLKFYPLVDSIAHKLALNLNDYLTDSTVDDLYAIAKVVDNKELRKECVQFWDKNAMQLNNVYLRRDIQSDDDQNVLTYALDKSRYINYIHFLLPEDRNICFNLMVSIDRIKWFIVQRNEEMWTKFWNWVYFEERRVKYIRIVCTFQERDNTFDIRCLRDDQFLCKRANVELEFDSQTKYLIPKHDVIEYPIPLTKHYYDRTQRDGYSYVTSKASPKEKKHFFIYHVVGDGKAIEFYLPQTCLIDSIRFHLWDDDQRTYDFTLQIRCEQDIHEEQEREDDNRIWHLIKDGDKDVFYKRSSWQTISFGGLRPVRWIRLTGIRAPEYDQEFAILHFECPAMKGNS